MDGEQKKAVVRVAAQYFIGMVTSQATEKEIDQVVMVFAGVYPRLLEATNRYYKSNNKIAPYLKFMHNWMLEQLQYSLFDFDEMLDRNGVQEIDPVIQRIIPGKKKPADGAG